MDEEIRFRMDKAHLRKYEIAFVATSEMMRWRKVYVRDHPHNNASLEQRDHSNSGSCQHEQVGDQSIDLEWERIESCKHDAADPDRRPMNHDHLCYDDILEQWF